MRPYSVLFCAFVCAFVAGACDLFDPVESESALQEFTRAPLENLLDGAVSLTLNPSGINPLAAELAFQTREPARITIEVLGAEPVTYRAGGQATEHRIPVLGLYPGIENRIVLRVVGTGPEYALDTLRLATAPLPEFMPDIRIEKADRDQMEAGWTLSNLSIGKNSNYLSYPILFDSNGDIRWYLDLSSFGGMVAMTEPLANGNLLFLYGSAVYEYDMLGVEINRWDTPGYWTHHDVIEKPDGNLIVAVDKSGIGTVEDFIIEIDRASGAIVNEWDLRQVLDMKRRDLVSDEVDWFHMNAIWYDEGDDALIISGRNQGLVKVTRDNRLVWILAPHKGWGKAGPEADGHETAPFLLTAVDASGVPYPEPIQQGMEEAPDFRWSWGQHAPLLLPNGNLFAFDNGYRRYFTDGDHSFSRGVEYVIDEAAMTVRQVWQYGEERGSNYYSSIISDVDYLPETGNRLIMPGIIFTPAPHARVTEVTYPAGRVVFDANIRFANFYSNGTFAYGQFDLVYRSERMPLYPTEPSFVRSTRQRFLRNPL